MKVRSFFAQKTGLAPDFLMLDAYFGWYPCRSMHLTKDGGLYNSLFGCFKQKANLIEAIFSHIKYSDILRERFAKAQLTAYE